jgi:hypothetical protein
VSRFAGGILSIDAATTTGWCYGHPGGKLTFGSIRFAKPGQPRAVTYHNERAWLGDRFVQYDPALKLVVFESPAVPMIMIGKTNIDTIRKLVTMAEIIEEMTYFTGIECREAKVSDVRAFFIGRNCKSAEGKRLTCEKCRDMGFDVQDDNAGDAVALWHYQVGCLRPDLAPMMTPLFGVKHGKTGRASDEW